MEAAVLMKPDAAYKKAYMSFYHEWKASGEKMIPWVIAKDPTHFEEMIQELINAEKGIGLKKGYVPDSTYWLMHNERVIGVVNIRHALSEWRAYRLWYSAKRKKKRVCKAAIKVISSRDQKARSSTGISSVR